MATFHCSRVSLSVSLFPLLFFYFVTFLLFCLLISFENSWVNIIKEKKNSLVKFWVFISFSEGTEIGWCPSKFFFPEKNTFFWGLPSFLPTFDEWYEGILFLVGVTDCFIVLPQQLNHGKILFLLKQNFCSSCFTWELYDNMDVHYLVWYIVCHSWFEIAWPSCYNLILNLVFGVLSLFFCIYMYYFFASFVCDCK